MKVVDFKTSGYFSGTMIFLGIVLLFTGLLLLSTSWIVGLIMLVISTVIFSTHYRLKVDFDKIVYHDYLWILGIKHGEHRQFETIEYVFIKRAKVSQSMHLKAASTTIHKDVYDGYLKFSETNKIHLLTADEKSELVRKLKVISDKLNSKIIDYSDGDSKEI
jgi:hypothetical protein